MLVGAVAGRNTARVAIAIATAGCSQLRECRTANAKETESGHTPTIPSRDLASVLLFHSHPPSNVRRSVGYPHRIWQASGHPNGLRPFHEAKHAVTCEIGYVEIEATPSPEVPNSFFVISPVDKREAGTFSRRLSAN